MKVAVECHTVSDDLLEFLAGEVKAHLLLASDAPMPLSQSYLAEAEEYLRLQSKISARSKGQSDHDLTENFTLAA